MPELPSTSFSPQRCAELHNQLVARAVDASSVIAPFITHNAFNLPGTPTRHSDDPETPVTEYLSGDIIAFFEAIDTWRVGPWGFSDYDFDGEYSYVILLYGDADSGSTGGLFFDMDTNLAYWVIMPRDQPKAKE
ncbi:hypothetical protein MMC30_009222 [Trapelia coarctata]|nr:hypothetical protein [Trapelia coarctata]